MNLNNGLSLRCVNCFQPQTRYMRQCRCLYCEMCRGQASERCNCGQTTPHFLDLFGPNQEEGLLLTIDSTNLLKKLVGQFQEHVLGGVQKAFGVLNRVQMIKEANMIRYIQHLEKQLAATNAENETLKSKIVSLQASSTRMTPAPMWRNTPVREQYPSVEPFETLQIRTPAPQMRHIVPRTSDEYREKTLKRPFSHEAFGAFFRK